jgi:hypothetical protein
VGQKVLSKPSADSFAVGRRQKISFQALTQRKVMQLLKGAVPWLVGSFVLFQGMHSFGDNRQ